MSTDSDDLKLEGALMGELKPVLPPSFVKTGVSPLEYNQQCINLLRFLLDDEAFSSDFLITAILAYYEWEMHREGMKVAADNPGSKT